VKIKKRSIWKDKQDNKVRVSRLRKKDVCFYPIEGGGKELVLDRKVFLDMYIPVHAEHRS